MYGMYREVWNTSGNADCQGVIFSKSIIGAGAVQCLWSFGYVAEQHFRGLAVHRLCE